MSKLPSVLITLALALTLLAGCSPGEAPPSAPPAAEATDPAAALTADRAGNPIVPPAEAERIIALAPSVTQTLVHLGLADKLVAVDTGSATVEGIPVGLPLVDMLSPDGEMLLTLDADLALCSAMTGYDGSDPLKLLAGAGTCVAAIPSSVNIEGIRADLMFIADLVGRHDEGTAIVSELDAGIQEVRDAVSGAAKKTVYFEIASAPAAYSFGAETFLNEMIETAGGENIFADMTGWLAVSEEQVVARDPDVIFTNVTYIDAPVDEILSREALRGVTAVRDGQVFYVDNFSSSLSNEYILQAIREMAAAMHPDLWPTE
ncbi:MAG: ABC transporter substrate-binding protein [Gracilibacteraceae bacterium]|jgi:iron complex transport system substrate-binding protein|nr:ABC transporter substrate-binding protein [Gracilibacteraceae bacterium]